MNTHFPRDQVEENRDRLRADILEGTNSGASISSEEAARRLTEWRAELADSTGNRQTLGAP